MTEQQKENEKKKKWLMRYKNAKALTKDLEEELSVLKLSKMCPSNIITGMPSGGSGGSDLSSYAAAVDILEGKILSNRFKLIRVYTEISDAINVLKNEEEVRIMRLRYLQGAKWDEIATKMQTYEIRQIYRMHGHALSKINIK